jgi:hypothetical protein
MKRALEYLLRHKEDFRMRGVRLLSIRHGCRQYEWACDYKIHIDNQRQ